MSSSSIILLPSSGSLAIGSSGIDNISETGTVDRVSLVDRRSMFQLQVPVNSGLLKLVRIIGFTVLVDSLDIWNVSNDYCSKNSLRKTKNYMLSINRCQEQCESIQYC